MPDFQKIEYATMKAFENENGGIRIEILDDSDHYAAIQIDIDKDRITDWLFANECCVNGFVKISEKPHDFFETKHEYVNIKDYIVSDSSWETTISEACEKYNVDGWKPIDIDNYNPNDLINWSNYRVCFRRNKKKDQTNKGEMI